MPALQQYVLEPVSTGDLDDQTIDEVLKVLRNVLETIDDLKSFSVAVNRKLRESFRFAHIRGVSGMKRNLYFVIGGVDNRPHRFCGMMVKAKFKDVRSLQNLSANQVACSVRCRHNLENLQVPSLVKRIVGKLIEADIFV